MCACCSVDILEVYVTAQVGIQECISKSLIDVSIELRDCKWQVCLYMYEINVDEKVEADKDACESITFYHRYQYRTVPTRTASRNRHSLLPGTKQRSPFKGEVEGFKRGKRGKGANATEFGRKP